MDNNNKQLFVRLYGVAIVLILGVLSLSVQAQYANEPTDFDRLLSGEFNAVAPPTVTNSDCDTSAAFDCSGVLYLRLSPTINIGQGDAGGNQLIVKMEARAGQEAIGSLLVPAVAGRCEGGLFPTDIEWVCVNFAGGTFVPASDAIPGNIDADNPANLMHHIEARFTYSKGIFPGNPDNFRTVCTGATDYTGAQVSPNPPRNVASSADNGVITYSYDSANIATDPGALTPAQRIQYPADDYAELMTLTCNLPATASAQLLRMSYHLTAYGNLAFGHHVGASAGDSYVTSPENSLEFFPLDGTNYIEHAEITEGGDGVLIEYAQAVNDNTNQAYRITTSDGLTDATPAISDTTWLNNTTVWLDLATSIYDNAGINDGSGVALDADRHALVTSIFPGDTSFGDNFGRASAYRIVLTRHMSPADHARTAPRMLDVLVAGGTESIAITFSQPVCGSPETGCDPLTADHFEVLHYEGDISETGAPTQLTIGSVNLTGDATAGYTAATLNINLSGVTIDSNDYLLVRTARNSRFTDGFITDRTIFSATKVDRDVPVNTPVETYSEAESGMLHLQSGALARAIPTIVYSLTNPDGNSNDYSIFEGDSARFTIAPFTITRTPAAYGFESAVMVSITRDSDDTDPDNFVVTVDGNPLTLTNDDDQLSVMITFAAGENTKTIDIQHEGNDNSNDDYIYTINVAPASIPGGGSREITYTITDDENETPTIPNRNIAADPGATQVTLNFQSAYGTVGSASDPGNRTFTRDVDYVITITRLASGDKPMLTLPSITMSATELGLDFAEGNSRPSAMSIRILLTRNDVVLIPGDSYMVEISVRDRANRFSSQSYEGDFTMLDREDFLSGGIGSYGASFRGLLGDGFGWVVTDFCNAGPDSDNDGIADAYELFIRTDCNSGVDDYLGSADPADISLDATIKLPLPSTDDVLVVAAGASIYTQVDTGVNCDGANCKHLKAFIVSSGLGGDDSDDAIAMATDRCPLDGTPSNPSACWVYDIDVDEDGNDTKGKVKTRMPLQLGYNLIDWVVADAWGNPILSTRQKQLIYVAPTVELNFATVLVLPEGETDITGSFRVQFAQGGGSIRFIGEIRNIPTLSFDCTPAASVSVTPSSATGEYTYTATDAGMCTVADVDDNPITFGVEPDPFYAVGNQITVERESTNNKVADVRIDEIIVTDSSNGNIVTAVIPTGSYKYEVTTLPSGRDVIVEITVTPPELFGKSPVVGGPDDYIPSLSGTAEEGDYISLTAAIGTVGTSASDEEIKAAFEAATITHTVEYPIVDIADAPGPDRDNDGVPDGSVDVVGSVDDDDPKVLLSDRISNTEFTTIEVLFGRVTLGNIARRNSHGQAQLDLSSTEVRMIVGDIPEPPGYNNEGIFEFDVYLPANTNTAFISIPLSTELNTNKGYVKYTTDGGWKNFIPSTSTSISTGDAYYSAPGVPIIGRDEFTCPSPVNPSSGMTQWGNQKNVLVKGHQCVLLVIKDNGPNDADGELNGIIVDPGAPGDDTAIVKGVLKFRIKVFLEGAQ